MYLKKMSWNTDRMLGDIQSIKRECCNPHNDGFTAFGLKQDLYIIKEAVDRALEACPNFHGEEEWLQEQEKLRIINILKQ